MIKKSGGSSLTAGCLLTSPFTPEWEYDAYMMNKGILSWLF
jgi:hypothetical protein